jgi:CheY-like chemotaxis protein
MLKGQPNLKVLLVDGDSASRLQTAELLRDAGNQVGAARSLARPSASRGPARALATFRSGGECWHRRPQRGGVRAMRRGGPRQRRFRGAPIFLAGGAGHNRRSVCELPCHSSAHRPQA